MVPYAGNPWAGLKDATPYEKGIFLPPNASFHLAWNKGQPPSPSPKNGDRLMFFAFEVLQSSVPAEHPIGEERSYCIKMNDPKMALRSLKSLLHCLFGLDHDPQRAATFNALLETGLMDHILGPANPCLGFDVGVHTVGITTKQNTPFTRHDWITTVADASRVDAVIQSFRSAGPPIAAPYAPPVPSGYGPVGYPAPLPPAVPGFPVPVVAPPPPPPPAPLPPGVPPGSPMHTDPASGRVAYLVNGAWRWV